MTICKPFNGPLTASALTQWIASCEDAFEEVAFERGKDMPDRLKITSAGGAITEEAESLYDWWTGERDDLKSLMWPEFIEKLKTTVLGVDWEIGTLEEFYRIEQGDNTIDQYIRELRAARRVVEKSQAAKIDDFQFKCHLLFRANPSLSAFVQSTPNFNFKGITVAQLETVMRAVDKYDEGYDPQDKKSKHTSSSFSVQRLPVYMRGRKSWELSEQWGESDPSGVEFSDLSSLPPNPSGFCRITSMGSFPYNSRLSGLKTVMHSEDSRATWVAESFMAGLSDVTMLSLQAGEYVNCIVFTKHGDHTMASIRFETNRGKNLNVGYTPTQDAHVFRAPRGKRIVGFHGQYASGKTYLRKVGVIYGSLLPGETEV